MGTRNSNVPKAIADQLENCDYIIGSDECGYGAWAGDLVVCAAIISRNWELSSEVTDSKKLSPTARQNLAKRILKVALCQVIKVTPEEIDKQGVYKALLGAHHRAIEGVRAKHEAQGCVGTILTIADGNLPIKGAISLPKADLLVPAVSAASIVGKVFRDLQMIKLAKEYEGYGFQRNKGYGTKEHQIALERLGPCAIHRKSYAPIARLLVKEPDTVVDLSELPQE